MTQVEEEEVKKETTDSATSTSEMNINPYKAPKSNSSLYLVIFLVVLVCILFGLTFYDPALPNYIETGLYAQTQTSTSNQQQAIIETMIQFHTKKGSFIMQLYADDCPNTVSRIRSLVQEGYYSGNATGFYRYEKDFVLQGGGFAFNNYRELSYLPVEYKVLAGERTVTLARNKKEPYQWNTEFAINLGDNSFSNAPDKSSSDSGYTTFGRIYRGWNTIVEITKKLPEGYLHHLRNDTAVPIINAKEINVLVSSNSIVQNLVNILIRELESNLYILTVLVLDMKNCEYCTDITDILSKMKASYQVLSFRDNFATHKYSEDAINDALYIMDNGTHPRSSVPLRACFFIRDEVLGYQSDFEQWNDNNKLIPLLQTNGVLAENLVNETVAQNSLVIFSKTYCPYSYKAKKLFLDMNILSAKVIELDIREDGPAIQYRLGLLTGRTTVPNVFIQGRTVGGSDDLQKLYESGELKKMLTKASIVS